VFVDACYATTSSSHTGTALPLRRSILIFFALAVTACSSDEPATPRPGVARPNTRVLTAQGRAALELVVPDGHLVFAAIPETLAIEVGQILASEPTSAAPYGLLRRVTSVAVDNDKVAVETVAAVLHEALKEAEGEASGEVSAATIDEIHHNAISIDLPFEKVLWDADGQADTTSDQLRVNAEVSVSAGFGVNYKIFDFDSLFDDLNPFDAVDLQLGVTLGLGQSASATITIPQTLPGTSIRKTVEEAVFDPIVFFLGPVPVVLVPVVSLDVAFNAGIAAGGQSYGVHEAFNASIGFTCNGDGCSASDGAFGPELSADLPTFSDFDEGFVELALIPRFEVRVYGLAGPYLQADVAARLNVRPLHAPAWDVVGRLVGRVGIGGAFGFDWGVDYFDESKVILQGSNMAPQFTANSSDRSVFEGSLVGFEAHVDDLEDGPLPVTVTHEANAFAPVVIAPGETFEVLLPYGPNIITETATDSGGATVARTIKVGVVNPAPEVALHFPLAGATFYKGFDVALHATAVDGFATQNGTIPCEQITWSGASAGDALPADNCGADASGFIYAQFNSAGARTLQVQADDKRSSDVATVAILVIEPPLNAVQTQLLAPIWFDLIEVANDLDMFLSFRMQGTKESVPFEWAVADCHGQADLANCDADQVLFQDAFALNGVLVVDRVWTIANALGAPGCHDSFARLTLTVDGTVIAVLRLVRYIIC